MKERLLLVLLMSACCTGMGLGEPVPAIRTQSEVREWTNTEGKSLRGEYLGVQGGSVVLKLPNGTTTRIPLATLSAADNAYVKQNTFEYRETWQAWPTDVQFPMSFVEVKETPVEKGTYIYTTSHFRFKTNVNLGTTLMKDLARVFELTYHLHSKSPFGILAKPVDGYYQARLFGTRREYVAAGAPAMSAGVYIPKNKVFMAPLDLMGVQPGASGWRKVSKADYDPSAIVHELTHMLTNDMLENLPLWVNEGYAEYIRCIPLENASFKASKDKIKQGVLDRLVEEYEKSAGRGVKIKAAERHDFLKSERVPFVYDIARVMEMTDEEWATGQRTVTGPVRVSMSAARMPGLYRTAHLIIYYFIQIEGEKGVKKIRRFLDENRQCAVRYAEFVENYKVFQEQVKEFMKKPGVALLANGRVQYPSNLTPPKEPKPPFTDPLMLKFGGIGALLDGEPAATVGKRIESALRQDLGANLKFVKP